MGLPTRLIHDGCGAGTTLWSNTKDRSWPKAARALHNGPQLDRVLLLSGITNGQALFKSASKSLVYPAFNSRMLPNEIVELNEASFAKQLGTEVLITSSNLRPKQLGGQRALMFDLTLSSGDQPTMVGRVAAFVHDGRLYEIVYLAAELHYFDKHWAEVLSLMESVRTGV